MTAFGFYVEKKSNDSYEQKQIAQYEKQLKSVQKKIDNIMMAVMQGIGIETAKDYLAPLEEDKKQLNKLIDQAKNSVKILDKERLFNIINSWLDIASLIAMSKQLEPDSDSYDTDDKRAKLYYRHMRAVLTDSNERITNSFDLESDRVTTINIRTNLKKFSSDIFLFKIVYFPIVSEQLI